MHTGSIPVGPTIVIEENTVQQPNPFDPWDDVRRWYRSLWPTERWAVNTVFAAIIVVLLLWTTK